MRSSRRSTGLSVLLASGLMALVTPPASAQPSFTGLGDLAGGSVSSSAEGVSANGSVVVGTSTSASGTEAFRWTAGGGMVGLGDLAGGSFSSSARGVSADGSVVVGTSASTSGDQAFRWTAGGGMVGLGDLPSGGFRSVALGVSGDGSVVVGYSNLSAESFRWTAGGGMVGLGDLPGGGTAPISVANSASSDGSVVVGRGTAGPAGHPYPEAFRWTAVGGMVGLGDLPGGNTSSEATGVSGNGSVVVGYSSSAASYSGLKQEAFRWTAGEGMVGLGALRDNAYFHSVANGVSYDGSVVVGTSWTDSNTPGAFIWDQLNGMRSVRDILVEELGLDLTGWQLDEAVGISANGLTIVGTGRHNGITEGWIAVIPEPGTALLFGMGLVALACQGRAKHS